MGKKITYRFVPSTQEPDETEVSSGSVVEGQTNELPPTPPKGKKSVPETIKSEEQDNWPTNIYYKDVKVKDITSWEKGHHYQTELMANRKNWIDGDNTFIDDSEIILKKDAQAKYDAIQRKMDKFVEADLKAEELAELNNNSIEPDAAPTIEEPTEIKEYPTSILAKDVKLSELDTMDKLVSYEEALKEEPRNYVDSSEDAELKITARKKLEAIQKKKLVLEKKEQETKELTEAQSKLDSKRSKVSIRDVEREKQQKELQELLKSLTPDEAKDLADANPDIDWSTVDIKSAIETPQATFDTEEFDNTPTTSTTIRYDRDTLEKLSRDYFVDNIDDKSDAELQAEIDEMTGYEPEPTPSTPKEVKETQSLRDMEKEIFGMTDEDYLPEPTPVYDRPKTQILNDPNPESEEPDSLLPGITNTNTPTPEEKADYESRKPKSGSGGNKPPIDPPKLTSAEEPEDENNTPKTNLPPEATKLSPTKQAALERKQIADEKRRRKFEIRKERDRINYEESLRKRAEARELNKEKAAIASSYQQNVEDVTEDTGATATDRIIRRLGAFGIARGIGGSGQIFASLTELLVFQPEEAAQRKEEEQRELEAKQLRDQQILDLREKKEQLSNIKDEEDFEIKNIIDEANYRLSSGEPVDPEETKAKIAAVRSEASTKREAVNSKSFTSPPNAKEPNQPPAVQGSTPTQEVENNTSPTSSTSRPSSFTSPATSSSSISNQEPPSSPPGDYGSSDSGDSSKNFLSRLNEFTDGLQETTVSILKANIAIEAMSLLSDYVTQGFTELGSVLSKPDDVKNTVGAASKFGVSTLKASAFVAGGTFGLLSSGSLSEQTDDVSSKVKEKRDNLVGNVKSIFGSTAETVSAAIPAESPEPPDNPPQAPNLASVASSAANVGNTAAGVANAARTASGASGATTAVAGAGSSAALAGLLGGAVGVAVAGAVTAPIVSAIGSGIGVIENMAESSIGLETINARVSGDIRKLFDKIDRDLRLDSLTAAFTESETELALALRDLQEAFLEEFGPSLVKIIDLLTILTKAGANAVEILPILASSGNSVTLSYQVLKYIAEKVGVISDKAEDNPIDDANDLDISKMLDNFFTNQPFTSPFAPQGQQLYGNTVSFFR